MPKPITFEDASKLLCYEPDTGVLRWKVTGYRTVSGAIAGCRSKVSGYVDIGIDYGLYKAHRLAWLLMTGSFPVDQIDHINGNRADNRWVNLREVDNTTNQHNRKRPRSDSTIGLMGVSRNGKGFKASIRVHGVRKSIGTFKTPEEAHFAYLEAKAVYHAEAL